MTVGTQPLRATALLDPVARSRGPERARLAGFGTAARVSMDRDALAAMPEAAPQGSVLARNPRRGSFRALKSRPFRRFFAGQVVSASGTFLQQTTIGWLVLQLTGSATSLGLVLAAGGLPPLLLGPWGGAIATKSKSS